MIELIKTKIWSLLKEKEVSLAMIYNREGEMLWHMGREIKGKTIENGEGFSKTYINQTLKSQSPFEEEYVVIESTGYGLPKSAFKLHVKSLIILPVTDNYFLYIDSGSKKAFNNIDREIFKVLGEILGEVINRVRNHEQRTGGITGDSEAIKKIRELVLKFSLEEAPILLLGETGVGKSHVAELIHRYSGRKGNFCTINTPSIPENLFESEIFGHKKGAFTDAKSDKRGYVDEAHGGTLFFDEISEVPVSFQAKLLRFIDIKKYTRLGESIERKADVRIIAATNKHLDRAIKMEQFREDLYYRLQVLEIEIPPLRNRREDIKALVMENIHLLKGKELGNGFWDVVYNHNWPGNVREVITVLTRAGIILDSPITGKDIKNIIDQRGFKRSLVQPSERIEQIWEEIKSGKSFWEVVWKPFLNKDLNRIEVKAILGPFYMDSHRNLKAMIQQLNIRSEDYAKFISAIHKYDVHPGK